MRALAISFVVALAATSAAAEKGALAYCQAQANETAYAGGAKTGYAAEYSAAVDSCLYGRKTAQAGAVRRDFRQPRNTPSVVGNCPIGVGPFYRGTLYCVN